MSESSSTAAPRPRKPGLSGRSRSRVCVMKCFYQYFLGEDSFKGNYSDLRSFLDSDIDYLRCNKDYFEVLFSGVCDHLEKILECLIKYLDRPVSSVTPIEISILVVSVFELLYERNVPAPVVINEGIELAKVYGGTDGYKYVNNVLDKVFSDVKAGLM
ncbi:transcription antitermination factor NusB [Candidatus Ichthyocystis hellenicum]|uniref:Transcription antitermination protein NusB n=1 Tax=Candidatus Ichthyocystis hellenicum TaxID=1561003 RepID=A0A0S4M0N9_9BURK|nr:transcription antitermination factor NusB [Candidatus Ichthyocystis hellenicum]CUT17381.1 transcription antitermination factor NusB [Candidatus Ichthyocystis hellenicum]